mgnify:CR=1 FL=1
MNLRSALSKDSFSLIRTSDTVFSLPSRLLALYGQWCQRLNKDLTKAIGAPQRLFAANEAEWPMRIGEGGMITDASFVWRDKESGNLLMLWSSFSPKYSIGQSISKSGSILGPWEHEKEPVFKNNGGHQMVFEDLEGNLKISFHSPNEGGSHLVIKDLKIKDGKFLPIE